MNIEATTTLNNGVAIPWFGLGVYKSAPGGETRNAVRWAIEAGYRHVDTAAFYANEADVADGIQDAAVDSDSVFVTTKLWNDDHGYERTLAAFDRSRSLLRRDVIDLYLIHWPIKGLFLDSWRAMEKLYAEGKVRAIGVSNFLIQHLEMLLENSEVPPAINQVEWHPFVLQQPLVDYCRERHIQLEAWSPLARGKYFDNPTISGLAQKYGKTPAQIMIRWDLEHGVVTIPKSVHRERILENSRVFDFSLTEEDVGALDALDRDERLGMNPSDLDN